MELTVNERFVIFFDSLGMKNEEFAKSIKATPKETSNWKSHTKIPLDRLKIILEKYDRLNARWLITGEGEMLISENYRAGEPASPYNTLENLKLENENLKKRVAELEDDKVYLKARLKDALTQRGGYVQGEIAGGVDTPSKTG